MVRKVSRREEAVIWITGKGTDPTGIKEGHMPDL